MTREVERTADGRYVVVDGRRCRTADPDLPDDARARVRPATNGLGERGPAWWDQDAGEREARWTDALRELDR
jgi:hypothetical protein